MSNSFGSSNMFKDGTRWPDIIIASGQKVVSDGWVTRLLFHELKWYKVLFLHWFFICITRKEQKMLNFQGKTIAGCSGVLICGSEFTISNNLYFRSFWLLHQEVYSYITMTFWVSHSSIAQRPVLERKKSVPPFELGLAAGKIILPGSPPGPGRWALL